MRSGEKGNVFEKEKKRERKHKTEKTKEQKTKRNKREIIREKEKKNTET
jgi:hypothetical protein